MLTTKKLQGSLLSLEQVLPITDVVKKAKRDVSTKSKDQKIKKDWILKREREEISNLEVGEPSLSKKRKVFALLSSLDVFPSSSVDSSLPVNPPIQPNSLFPLAPPSLGFTSFLTYELISTVIQNSKSTRIF